jgi:hypothetical protein
MEARRPPSVELIFSTYDDRRDQVRAQFTRDVLTEIHAGRFVVDVRNYRDVLEVRVPLAEEDVGFLRTAEPPALHVLQIGEPEAHAEEQPSSAPRAARRRSVSMYASFPVLRDALNEALRPCFGALMVACSAKAEVGACRVSSQDRTYGDALLLPDGRRRIMSLEFSVEELHGMLSNLTYGSDPCAVLDIACQHTGGSVELVRAEGTLGVILRSS